VSEFHFLRPAWLLALLPLAWLSWRLWRERGDAGTWRGVVEPHLLAALLEDGDDRPRRRLPLALLAVGWLVLVVALAGPTWERLPQPVYQAQQYRVVVIDIGLAMNVADVRPSRLAQARFEAIDLVRQLREGQVALIAYGAEPYIVSPLTSDGETIIAQVPLLETALLPTTGPPRADLALALAGDLLRQAGAPDGDVVLVSHGVRELDRTEATAAALRADGYRVSTLGVGTSTGAPLPLPGGEFARDARGDIVLSRLDAQALAAVADAGGGVALAAAPGTADIQALAPADGAGMQRADTADAQADRWREAGPWLVLLLLPLAALAFRRGWVSPLGLALAPMLLPVQDATAFDWQDLWLRQDQQAMQRLEAGDAAAAAERFARQDWRAAAAYRAGDYQGAVDALPADDADAAYNRGNALARLGKFEDAITAYDQALAENPNDADARHNRELLERLLQQREDEAKAKEQQNQDSAQAEQAQSGGESSEPPSADAAQRDDSDGDDEGESDTPSDAGDPDPASASEQASPETEPGESQGDESRNSADPGEAGSDTPAAGTPEPADGAGGRDSAPENEAAPGEQQGERRGETEARESAQADDRPQSPGEAGEQRGDAGEAGSPEGGSPDAGDENDGPAQSAGDLEQRDPAPADASGDPSGDGQAPVTPDPAGEPNAAGTDRGETEPQAAGENDAAQSQSLAQGRQPGLEDLVGGGEREGQQAPSRPGGDRTGRSPGDVETEQAIEQMLRRVDEDPGGLLRQRFLLQHLRRSGQMP
jgi:Ca-activated chloride channel family protein